MNQDDNNRKNNPQGPLKAGNWTVIIDRNLCIGAASCVAIAPKVFQLDNEAKAIFLDTGTGETHDAILDAAKSCPVAAIIIQDEKGQQIYP